MSDAWVKGSGRTRVKHLRRTSCLGHIHKMHFSRLLAIVFVILVVVPAVVVIVLVVLARSRS